MNEIMNSFAEFSRSRTSEFSSRKLECNRVPKWSSRRVITRALRRARSEEIALTRNERKIWSITLDAFEAETSVWRKKRRSRHDRRPWNVLEVGSRDLCTTGNGL